MYQAFCRFVFLRILGWKYHVSIPNFSKTIICVAPHTSNWDFIIAQLFYGAIGRRAGFLMKKEWFFFPLNLFWRAIGGIPVDRSKKTSLVEQIAAQAKRKKKFHLAITPEGTRKKNPNWKMGFYYIALNANIPISVYAIDYRKKEIYGEHSFVPSGNVEKEMALIRQYYSAFKEGAKYPQYFSVGETEKPTDTRS